MTQVTIDWTQVILAVIAGLPVLLASVVTMIVSLRNSANISTLRDHVNSKMDALLVATKAQAGLEGEARGQAAGQQTAKDLILDAAAASARLQPSPAPITAPVVEVKEMNVDALNVKDKATK